jgi:copper resistance protein C
MSSRPALRRTGVTVRRLAALVAATTLALGCSLSVAAAHTKLESMTPADGSTVPHPPKSVVLRFDEPVGDAGTEVVVKAPDGVNVSSGSPEVVGSVVTQPLGTLTAAGRYLIDARIVSTDGHPITVAGSFTVTHADRATGQPAAPASTSNSGNSASVVIVAIVLLMLVVVALAIVIVRRRPAPESQ